MLNYNTDYNYSKTDRHPVKYKEERFLKNSEIIQKMTLEEKSALLSGKGEWQTWNFDRLGIPSIYCSDGPHGIRKQAGCSVTIWDSTPSLPATCCPTAATMANTWDPALGEELGQDARRGGQGPGRPACCWAPA